VARSEGNQALFQSTGLCEIINLITGDFAVEIFGANNVGSYDARRTSLRSAEDAERYNPEAQAPTRLNVDIPAQYTSTNHELAEIDVIPFQLETPELVTVQRWGFIACSANLVDTNSGEPFFCASTTTLTRFYCWGPEYAQKDTKTIHIPIRNEITQEATSLILSVLAKRAKLPHFRSFAISGMS
jgi:hypothetical protein